MVLHVIAFLFAAVLLFITIPAHLIYIAVKAKKRDPSAPNPFTHVRCPDCKELVRKEATVCKHCGCKLVPQE
jgi:cytochrome c oxidase assembly factor CtaG